MAHAWLEEKIKDYSLYCKVVYVLWFDEKSTFPIKSMSLLRENQVTKAVDMYKYARVHLDDDRGLKIYIPTNLTPCSLGQWWEEWGVCGGAGEVISSLLNFLSFHLVNTNGLVLAFERLPLEKKKTTHSGDSCDIIQCSFSFQSKRLEKTACKQADCPPDGERFFLKLWVIMGWFKDPQFPRCLLCLNFPHRIVISL